MNPTTERSWTGEHHRMNAVDLAALSFCGLAAFILCYHAGRIGFMPLDQSIVFDGAWRVANGQIPWRDFMTPDSLVPIVIQSVVFAIAGTNWTTFVVHAAAVNALGAMFVFGYLRTTRLGTIASASGALATAVWLYPLMGTPYRDQHSLFFAGCALLASWRAAEVQRAPWWWIAAGVTGALALMSKAIPAAIVLPLAALSLLISPTAGVARGLLIAGVAGVSTVTAALGALVAAGAHWTDIVESVWLVPAGLGPARLSEFIVRPGAVYFDFYVAMRLSFWSGLTLIMGTVMAIGVRVRAAAATRHVLAPMTCALALMATTVVSAGLTWNEPVLLAGLLPLAFALLLLALLRGLEDGTLFSHHGARVARMAAMTAMSLALIGDATRGYWRVVLARQGHDMVVTAHEREPAPPARLADAGFSVWRVPEHYTSAATSFDRLITWLDQHPGNFVLAGDEAIVYGLTGRPSISPILWIHPGLTFRDDAVAHERLRVRLEDAMTNHQVRWIVLPANTPWMSADTSPAAMLAERFGEGPCEAVGDYRICERDAGM